MSTTQYTSNDQQILIQVREKRRHRTAWALFIQGVYQYSKILPNTNTAVVQNFGYAAADFTQAPAGQPQPVATQ